MESSSNDSFLWTGASNDSVDSRKDVRIKLMEVYYDEASDTGANCEQKKGDRKHGSDIESQTKNKLKKTKKIKHCERKHERSDHSPPDGKIIKQEPESDIDIERKKNLKKEKNTHNIDAQDSILYDKDYLNLRVKQEQSSSVQSKKKKKKKHKRSNSNTDHECESDYTTENMESTLEFRVKQELVSVVEPEIVKLKKKKKHKNTISTYDEDITSEIRSKTPLTETTVLDNSLAISELTENLVIEEKFSAEETVIEKPRNRKFKVDAAANNIGDDDNEEYGTNQNEMTLEGDSDKTHTNDLSMTPNDFTCNNIVSSTIINDSTTDKQKNKTEDLMRKSRNKYATKISDRIRFEDDNFSQQESVFSKISPIMNKFLKLNPYLQECVPKSPKDTIITKDDEIWILTWPHGVDVEKFKNTTISSERKCKIKIDGQTYDGHVNEDEIRITLLTHHHEKACITNLQVQNCIDYHKRIPKVHVPDNNVMINNQTNFTLLPETKCRHPLFGSNYDKAIKYTTSVTKRLQAARERLSENAPETNKKKHKKYKNKSVEIKMEEDHVSVKSECEPVKRKKKRKHSHSECADARPKNPKRYKPNVDSPALWESEQAIEENLFSF